MTAARQESRRTFSCGRAYFGGSDRSHQIQWQWKQLNQYNVEWTRPNASMSSPSQRGHRTISGGSGTGNIFVCSSNFAAQPDSRPKWPDFAGLPPVALRPPRLLTDSETLEVLVDFVAPEVGNRLA